MFFSSLSKNEEGESSSSLYSGRRRDLEEEEDKMVSSRIATQTTTTTTTTTNGIVVATKKTKKVRFISVCFLSSFAQQRFCRLVDFLYDGREFSGRDGMLRRQRSNPSSSLSRRASLGFFFLRVPVWCRCRDAVVVVVVVAMSRLVARAFSSVDHESRSCMVSSNDAQIASMMNSHVHKTHRSNPSNERRKQRRRSLP